MRLGRGSQANTGGEGIVYKGMIYKHYVLGRRLMMDFEASFGDRSNFVQIQRYRAMVWINCGTRQSVLGS